MTDLEKRYDDWRKSKNGIEVYNKALEIATGLHGRGHRHYSIRAIIYVIRYNYDLTWGKYKDGFKINNNWTAYLARELMATGKLPAGFFETREIKHDLADDQQALSLY